MIIVSRRSMSSIPETLLRSSWRGECRHHDVLDLLPGPVRSYPDRIVLLLLLSYGADCTGRGRGLGTGRALHAVRTGARARQRCCNRYGYKHDTGADCRGAVRHRGLVAAAVRGPAAVVTPVPVSAVGGGSGPHTVAVTAVAVDAAREKRD